MTLIESNADVGKEGIRLDIIASSTQMSTEATYAHAKPSKSPRIPPRSLSALDMIGILIFLVSLTISDTTAIIMKNRAIKAIILDTVPEVNAP